MKLSVFMPTGILKQMYGILSGPEGLFPLTRLIDKNWIALEKMLQSGIDEENAGQIKRLAGRLEVYFQQLDKIRYFAVPRMLTLMDKADEQAKYGPSDRLASQWGTILKAAAVSPMEEFVLAAQEAHEDITRGLEGLERTVAVHVGRMQAILAKDPGLKKWYPVFNLLAKFTVLKRPLEEFGRGLEPMADSIQDARTTRKTSPGFWKLPS